MSTNDNNGTRTHEPSLRELTSELDGVRGLLDARIQANREILDERDRLYKERDDARRTAVDAALAAVKEQTKASFEASEKAIVKAEEAQKSYNSSHNDLARKMDDQNKATMPRPETETRFQALEEKITSLRDAVSTITGGNRGGKDVRDDTKAMIAIAISFIVLVLEVATRLFAK